MRVRVAIIASLLWVASQPLRAQRMPAAGGLTESLGQPGPWSWSVGFGLGLSDRATETAGIGEFRIGLFRELISRTLGGGGIQTEMYNRSANAKYEVGFRARLVSPVTGAAVGVDYNVNDGHLRAILTYLHPIRRGGLFFDGSSLRGDFIAAPNRTVSIGIEKSLFDRIPKGTTRPRSDQVKLEGKRPPSAPVTPRAVAQNAETTIAAARHRALDTARSAARNIQRLNVPWLDHTGSGGKDSDDEVVKRLNDLLALTSRSGANLNVDRETVRFHNAIDRAFSLAVIEDGASPKDTLDEGIQLGNQARLILLQDVLYPYNFTLGQVKEDDTTLGLDTFARGAFLTWLHRTSHGSDTTHYAVSSVFDALLEMVEEGRATARREWGTSRFVWLPLQYGLRAEQHDTQAELDEIVEQATRQSFVAGNRVSYVINEQFQNQLSRTIREAKSYHVLWTHDFRGKNKDGHPDSVGFRQVLQSYLATLIERVKAYDSTGTFPTYIILLDEWFYEVNDGRRWMNLLQDPMHHEVDLPARFSSMEDLLRVAQDSLRAAVLKSALLTDHKRQYGDKWLRNLVKVHVNITNAPDPSFWSWHVATGFPLPDGWMRDHRKIVFYDVSETDPNAGEAILTGVGIGEHYANRAWEDRSLLVKGPVNLRLKAAARDALLKQGMAAAHIPAVLQPQHVASDDTVSVRRSPAANSLPIMQLQNGTGFDTKEISVAKAVLYTLMPDSSVIEIPDSIWNGTFWGSALLGAALRGVRVVVIAPSDSNAPAKAFGSMIRSRELLSRLVMASDILGDPIRDAGGMLKVGMFNSTQPVTNVYARLEPINRTIATHHWLGDLYPWARRDSAEINAIVAALTAANPVGVSLCGPDSLRTARPLLHMKANFLASPEAWDVMKQPKWGVVMKAYLEHRIAQLKGNCNADLSVVARLDTAQVLGDSAVQRWFKDMSPVKRDQVMFYTVLGSANQNDRSMVSDGEVAMLLSQWPAVIPYLDFLLLVGQSEWIENTRRLDELLPRQSGLKRRIAHWFKHIF